jgi:outer membrane receptor protein involved in Fe transport
MSYSDSSGQAMGGLINMHYNNHLLQSGINFLYLVNTKLGIYFNTEEQISHLSTNSAQIAIPNRYHNFSVLGFNWYNEIGKIAAQLSSQYVEEENSFIKRTPVLRFNPFLSFETKEYGKKMKLQFNTFYRNSFRMPSFSELYYNSIGNINLKPEDANQLSLGYLWNFKWNKIQLMQRGNAYFNQVRNKIIAIPTKNLFIWSMQNIGKVNVFGIDESLELNYSFSSNWSAFFNLNYTYQAALDITDKESPTFKNQVAYIPKHTGNMDLTLKRKNSGLRVSSFMSSFKYALNENVQSNQIDGYATLDLAVFTALKFKMNELRIQLTCKNCTNTSYAVVRYYVMPGRSYLITLNYALK